jgi:hypothetical protein
MKLALINIFGMFLLWGQDPQPRGSSFSVCDVLANRIEYNERIVEVRGIVKGGHGAWLVASSDCHYQLTTRGVHWPNIIYLVYPDNHSKIESYHADFEADWKSIRKAERHERAMASNVDTDLIVRTYVGLFRTYEDLGSRVNPGIPGALRLGFGPLGEAPAQLVIKSVKDVQVVHPPVQR